jgi:hypothetical protein
MNWGVTGLLVVFGAFILLLVFRPSMSCFGRRLKSPFYPLMRRRKNPPPSARPAKTIKTDDYGFKLAEDGSAPPVKPKTDAAKKAADYGFKLD